MIRILDENTINQIAAGEVIERAASVVKELLENAIDAKATFITIETKAGGRKLISIRDNGVGMNSDDLLLCVERHATSKILSIDDLWALKTLGFRGEALSSIGSVSKMNIHSCKEGVGNLLVIEGGKILNLQPKARAQGTTVEVTSLFYNVPARKNFQKTVTVDTAEIHKVIVNAAICHPEVGFEWIHDDKTELSLSSNQTFLQRIELLLGKQYAEALLPMPSGFIAKPYAHKPNRLGQYLFINDRAVSSPFISRVILEGFGHRLPTGRFPQFVLHLKLPPEELDVNVHPRKLEVRLEKEEEVRKLLLKEVKNAFEKDCQPVATTTVLPKAPVFSLPPQFFSAKQEVEEKPEPMPLPSFTLLFVFEEYLFIQKEKEELLVVDESRARSRIFFEKVKSVDKTCAQFLMFPLVIKKTPLEFRRIERHLELLNSLFISIRPFGKDSFCVDAIPDMFTEKQVIEFIDSIEDEEVKAPKMIAQMCQKAKRKNMAPHEAQALIKALFNCKENALSADAKPIFYRISPKEISKWLE